MIPNINPKQMQKMMKKMGLKQEEIDAQEVIIKLRDKNLVISDPQVMKVRMMGEETFQISGQVREENIENFTEGDIKTVMEQTDCTHEEAKNALEETNDLAEAILKLKKE